MTRIVLTLAMASVGLCSVGETRGAEIQALVGQAGHVRLSRGKEAIAEIRAGVYNTDWSAADAVAATRIGGSQQTDPRRTGDGGKSSLRIAVPGGGQLSGWATIVGSHEGLKARYEFTPDQDLALNSLHVSANFGIPVLAGGRWTADDRSGTFPPDFGSVHLFNGLIRKLTLQLPGGGSLHCEFPEPLSVLLQDNRQWGPSFSVRISKPQGEQRKFIKDVPVPIEFTLSAPGGIDVEHDMPVTIVADKDWIPLQVNLDIQPGSALDFSALRLQDPPAGKYGWLLADSDGRFSFEQAPGKPVRFYGVNLCFSAHYLTHEQADRVADRLARLGYNAVRVHHYEGELTEADPQRTRLNPEKLDQLDYLLAALYRRGIYVTTDLFVSRPVDVAQFGLSTENGRRNAMNGFKTLAALNPAAFENWKAFARNLLEHVNPYTKRAYKDEPGLAWLALVNEGNVANFASLAADIPDYRTAWNRWLAERYPTRGALAEAWGAALKADEDPGHGSVKLAGSIQGQDLRSRDQILFFTDVERDFFRRAKAFLRDELGVRALLTNMNGWTNHAVSQSVRAEMDYVDDHFYVDHPHFLEQSWRLPSRCPNTSPVAGGASGGRHLAFTRLFSKPFTVTEYNYSAPGRYRGVGGILTGALGAIQGWDGIWRFAYSHSREALIEPVRLDYFNMASDPLGQAAERASICLFLRGDLRTAPRSLALAMTSADFGRPPAQIPRLAPDWHWTAWLTRVGVAVVDDPARKLPFDLTLPLGWATARDAYATSNVVDGADPYQLAQDKLFALLRQHGILTTDNPTAPETNTFRSETGQITIDAAHDRLTLDTPRTAGGFATAGDHVHTTHGVQIRVEGADATVWVSALDDAPIRTSRRLLVTHLTDLQNTGIRYAERARQTLLDWGRLPHLVRAGRAEVRIQLADPSAYRVWALASDGQRLTEIPSQATGGELVFTADVSSGGDRGAILCYEIACP